MSKSKINRILLKLSGEALMGDDSYGIKLYIVDRIALDIKALAKQKINICIFNIYYVFCIFECTPSASGVIFVLGIDLLS